MIKELLLSGFTCLSLSQAQAMMDPSDPRVSTNSSSPRQLGTLPRQDVDKGASSAISPQASDHEQTLNSDVKNDDCQVVHDRNASLAKKREFERRLSTLESQLNNAQIGDPRNVVQLSVEQMDRLRRNKQRQLEEAEENCQK